MGARLTQNRRVWRRGRYARFEKRASQWRFGLEGLEPRQVLTADLTVAQTAALLRGVEVFTEQVSAMQLSGALAEQAVGIAQPIGTILSVGDELRRHVAEPLAADLRSVQGAITPAMVQAAIDRLAPTGSVAIREPGDGTLWFDVDLAGSRELVDFTLDVGQRPSVIPGQQTLYDRGLRLEPLEVDVTAGYAGRVSFGIDLAADLTAEQAVRIDVGTLRVFARATHSGAAALADLDASFGSVRLGPADVDVDFDVAAAIDLAGGPKRLGEILGVPARDSFTVIPAIDSRFQVSIPFTLGIGGFAETGTELRVGIGATGFFHEATDVAPLTLTLLKDTDPGAGVSWQPGSLSPGEGAAFTAPGEFGLAPFGGVSANDLGAFLVELERVAPTLFERLDVPLVGKSVGEIAEIGGRVSDFVASLRTPEGDFRFETADDLLDELAEFFGVAGQPRDRSTFDMKWSMATQGLQFRVPLEYKTPDAGLPLVFDAGSLRSALPAVVPIDVTGRGTATVHVDATTLALVGGVTKRDAAGLPDRRVTLDTSFADALRDLDLPDLLAGGAEFSFGLRNGTRVDVNLDGVLPAWRQNGATMRDVRDFLNGVAPASLAVDLVDGSLRFTDKTSGPNLFKVVLGEEQTITPSVTGGDPLTTTRLSLAALAFGLTAAPTAGDTLEGVSLELSALRDRLYFKPQAEGTVAIKLDVDVRAAVSLGTLTVGTHPLAAGAAAIRSTVAVVPSLGTAVAAGDGRITLEELETAGAAAVSLSVTPSSHAGVLQLDAPAALVGELGIDIAAYQSAPLDNLAAVKSATRTVPYMYLADSASGSTWSFDVQPSEKLVELATGIGNVSLADLDRIFEAFLDKLGKIDFWNLKLPGIDRSFGELFPFANALECLEGFDVKTLGSPVIDAATGKVTWPAGSFGALATDFLAKSMAAQQTFSQGSAAVQAAGMRLQSLAWELQALLVEIQNHPPGDPAADLGLLQRVRNLTRAATAEMAGLPENFNDLRTSLAAIPTVLDGLKFSLDSFAGRLADAIACGVGHGHDSGTGGEPNVPKVKVTPRKGGAGGDDTGGGIPGPTGQILFDIEIDFAGVKRSFDFSALDITVGGATLPFEITGTGQLQYAFGGTFATQIGWDFTTHSPILVAAATHADLTASIGSVNQTGFTLTASLGGLADISIGTAQTPATIRLTAAPNSPAGTPATFSLAADGTTSGHAYFEAVLPLFAASVVADGPLGTATLEATFSKPAAGSATFDVSADFDPDDINLDALFTDVAFDPDHWKELICGFMTDVTNDFLAKKLAQLPLVGGIDFSKVTFFEDVCAFIERLDFGSPGSLNQSVPQEEKEYVKDPVGGGYVVKTPTSDTPTVLIADPPPGRRGVVVEVPGGGTKTGSDLPDDWGKLGLRDRVILPITMQGSRQIKIGEGELDVGLDGLGITLGGAATLDLDFTLDIGLGFSRLEGFFIQTLGTAENKADEVTVSASLKLDDAAIGIGLGPVKLTATDTREEPELVATLAADLDSGNAGGIGRSLSLTQIPAALVAADFKGSLQAGLDLDLKADLFGTEANGLPGLAATLHTGFAKVTAGAAAGNGSPTYDPVEFTKLSDFSAGLADSLYFEITDVGVDLGSLLSGPIKDLLGKINDLLKPVRPMVDLLLAEVPVVSDVSKKAGLGAVTFLTLVKAYDADAGAKAEKFLQTVRDVTTVADTLARTATTGRLSLGTLAVLDAAKAQLLGKSPVTAAAFQPGKAAASGQDSVGALASLKQLDDGKIVFPIFDNPLASAFGLLFGKDVDLVTWDVPDLTNVGFGFEQSFPIFPPLFARIFGSVEFNTDIDVGYDTRGIRLALAGDEVNPEKLAYGVYLADIHGGRDTPEVSLTATIGAAAELNVVVAKAGAAGGLRGTIGANLRDPNGDGKVHLDEFMRLFNKSPECIFDFEGSLDAFFAAYLKLGFSTPFGFVTLFSAGMDLLDIRLLDWAAKTCPIEPPKLAAVVDFFDDVQRFDSELMPPNFERVTLLQQQGTGKVLALNLGARAGVDGFADDSEEFEVVPVIDPTTQLPKRDTAGNLIIVVRGRGIDSVEFNEKDFDFIWFDGRAGNDVITIDPAITKPVVGHGGDGNDRITGGSGRNFLFGDLGRDRLLGRGGIDELHGGGDGDLLVGYGGNDVLFGGEGADQLLGDDEIGDMQEFNTKHPEFVAGQPGADTIDGGLDSDTIFGGDGNDRLLGEESTDGFGWGDTIRGGNGDDTLVGQGGSDQLYGDAGNDVIWGDSEDGTYDSQLDAGNSDLIEGGTGANFLWGGADRDFLYAFSQEIGIEAPGDSVRDFAAILAGQERGLTPESGLPLYASSAGTWSRALAGSTTSYSFASWLEGGPGDDLLVGTKGADRIGGGFEADEIRGGTGDDLLAGGPGSDWIVSMGGNSRIFGGHGDDVIEGGPGNNWIEGGPGDDEIYAGLGRDVVWGGTTAAGYDAFIRPFEQVTGSVANVEPGRPIEAALHGGFRTRPTQDPQASACEPDVFFHPEVYPDAPFTLDLRIFEDRDGGGTEADPSGTVDPVAELAIGHLPWSITVEHLVESDVEKVYVPDVVSPAGSVRVPGVDGLPAGTYRVTVTGDADFWRRHDGPTFTADVTLDAEYPHVILPAGFFRPGRIGGIVRQEQPQGEPTPLANASVYVDANDSGAYDVGEKTARTNAQGRYWFDYFYPGDYHVRLAVDPARWDVFPLARDVALQSGQVRDDRDFTVAERLTGTIRGTVLGEPKGQPREPLSGLTVFLDVIANGVLDLGEPSTITGADGSYRFDDVPAASYAVRLDTSPLQDVAVTDPAKWTVNLFDGQDASARDFLVTFQGDTIQRQPLALASFGDFAAVGPTFTQPPVGPLGGSIVQLELGTIMGSVWLHDADAQETGFLPDLVKGRSEPGIADQTISLYREENGHETLVATTTSSRQDASFQFAGLPSGRYIVRQTPTRKFVQVTGGGVSKPESLFAVTSRAVGGTDAGKSTLWEVSTSPFAATGVGSFTEFVARDLAMFDRSTAYIAGTATAGGASGLWRYDVSSGGLTNLGPCDFGTLVALDVLDAARLIGVTDGGALVTYTPDINLWQQLGRLQTTVGNEPQPVYAVGDLAVRSPQEVYFVGYVGSPPDLSPSGFPSPARQQAVFQVDTTLVSAGLTLTADQHADIDQPAPAKDEYIEYLTGLERTVSGGAFALGSLGSVFAADSFGGAAAVAFARAGRIFAAPDNVTSDHVVYGGLAVTPYAVVPDTTRTDFRVTITGRQVVSVGFGNAERVTRLYDGDDTIDGGCDASADLLIGDDARDVTFDLVQTHLSEIGSFIIDDDIIIYGGRDTIRGRGGDDRIDGGLQGDVLAGDAGNDMIQGGRGGARADGTVGTGNWLDGGDGDDSIAGGGQADAAYGGAGKDTILGMGGDDELFGQAGADALDGGDGDDLLVVGAGGGSQGQTAIGGFGDDTIVVRDVTLGGEFAVAPTGQSADTYRGDGGMDTLVLDTSPLAAADDLLFVSLSNAQLNAYGVDTALGIEVGIFAGGAGDNVFSAGVFTGRVVMRGNGGKDTLTGGDGDDLLDAGIGVDNQLAGGRGDDRFLVGVGSTTRINEFPNAGTDTLDLATLGSAGFDVRVGNAVEGATATSTNPGVTVRFFNDGVDQVLLGNGSNSLTLRNGMTTTARFVAGGGTDSIRYTDTVGDWGAWAAGVAVDLAAGTATGTAGAVGFDHVVGGEGNDQLSGTDGDNRLDGRGGSDTLTGRGGDDTLLGGAGDDFLFGNAGDDTLRGEAGTNVLAGNADDDTYEFLDEGQTDTVAEIFNQGSDRMLFSPAAGGILFEVGGQIGATFGTSRVTALSSAGIDLVRGGLAADTFRIADGAAFAGRLEGGGTSGSAFADLDTLDYSLWTSPVTVDYSPVASLATPRAVTGVAGVVDLRHVIGGSKSDSLAGGAHPVWFQGGDGGDTIVGSSAGDLLEGDAGGDTIRGEGGVDLIRGGTGNDTLAGGAGNDTFGFAAAFGVDTVSEALDGGSDAMDFTGVNVPLTVTLGSVTATTAAGDKVTHADGFIERVVGGSADDTFLMSGPDVTFPGTLDGGGGVNTLTYKDPTRAIATAVAVGETPHVGAALRFAAIKADSNLFPPFFTSGFTGAVNENADASTVVYTARATDADDAPGNTITYSLKTGQADDAALVTVDPAKGEVRLKTPANFEAKNAYRFTIVATDAGIPAKSAETAVTINVLNVVEPRSAPRITAPTGFFFTEDTPGGLRFVNEPFSDADSAGATVMTVTLGIADGVIAAANGGGVVVGGAPNSRTFAGTLANLNAFFMAEPARITYTPAANVSGTRTLAMTIAEGPVTQRLSSIARVPVTILAVNDAPVLRAPMGFAVTEDVTGNIVWPAGLPVVRDVDSAPVTVRLTVDAGVIGAAPASGVAVSGTPRSRAFTGTSAAVSAYFATIGRIRYTAPRNDTANRTLLCEAGDGVTTVSASRTIRVTPVNDPPTIAAVVAFGGGVRNTPFEVTHDMLGIRSGAVDVDSRTISYRVEAIRGGTLQRWDGAVWRNVSVAAAAASAQRWILTGQKVRWIPPAGAVGVRPAFTVRAWDGRAFSAVTAVVTVQFP